MNFRKTIGLLFVLGVAQACCGMLKFTRYEDLLSHHAAFTYKQKVTVENDEWLVVQDEFTQKAERTAASANFSQERTIEIEQDPVRLFGKELYRNKVVITGPKHVVISADSPSYGMQARGHKTYCEYTPFGTNLWWGSRITALACLAALLYKLY